MTRLLVFVALLLVAAFAPAATFTLTIQGPNVGTYTKAYTVPDADAARILAAWGVRTGQQQPQAIVDGIADEFLNHVLRETQEHDKRVAAEAAVAAVPEIVVDEVAPE